MPKKSAKFYLSSYFAKWNWFEYLLLFVSLFIPIIIGLFFGSNALEIILSILMPICAILAAKGRIESRIIALIIGVLYIIVSYHAQLYGEIAVTLVIFFPIKIYGLVNWLKNRKKTKGEIEILKTSGREILIVLVTHLVVGIGLYFLLGFFNTAFLLVSTIAAAINAMATWFLSRRSILAFPTYIILDFLQLTLWLLVFLGGDSGVMVLVATMAMFVIIDVYGMLTWFKMRKAQEANA